MVHATAQPIDPVDTARTKRPNRARPAAPPHPGRPRRAARRRGYACGEDTRQRILETAITLFAQLGFQGTSTRAIARRARVSLPALQYYFDSKDGLHHACIEYMTEDVHARLGPALTQAREVLSNGSLKRAQLLELLRSLIEPLIEGLATDRPESWVLFFARAHSDQHEAFEAVYAHFGRSLMELLTEIIARLLGAAHACAEARIRAVAIVGQATLVRRERPLLLKSLGWAGMTGERLTTLKRVLWQSIEASLGGP